MRLPRVTLVTCPRGPLRAEVQGHADAGPRMVGIPSAGSVIQVTEVSRPSERCSGDEGESRDRTGMSCPSTAQHQPPIGCERSRLAAGSARDAAWWSDRDRDAHPGSTGPRAANRLSDDSPPPSREHAGHRVPDAFRAFAGRHPQPRPGPGRSRESRPGHGQPHPDGPGTHAQSNPAAGDKPARVQGR